MATIWYSQPEIGYSSYYYYDRDASNHPLVRIRLALDGPTKTYSGIYFVPFARVGFFPHVLRAEQRKAIDVARDGTLIVPFKNFYRPPDAPHEPTHMVGMAKEPAIGQLGYYISEDPKRLDSIPRAGEPVIDAGEARLLPGLTRNDLESIAIACLKSGRSLKLAAEKTPEALLANINVAIHFGF